MTNLTKNEMAEKYITIRVYRRDADRLDRMFGTPRERAFHLALAQAPCDHPEASRVYTYGHVPADGQEELVEGAELKRVHGYLCSACGYYIFPTMRMQVEA